jgi:hypothetical protein
MEARVKIVSFLAGVTCFSALGCDRDPASDVRIIARPTAAAGSVTIDSSGWVAPPAFRPGLCTVQPEKSKGSSKFVARGPCTFDHGADVKCTAVYDDFYTALLRPGLGDATVAVYFNIETGTAPKPGKYTGGQMFLTVQNGQAYYHWGSDSVTATIGPGMKYVDVPETRLQAEPPNTGTETISGRFGCLPDESFAPIIVR